jgi:hypothetical protein
MCNNKIGLFQLVEIPVSGTGTKVKIPDQPQLRIQGDQKIYVTDIELFTDSVMPVSPDGNTNATNAELLKAALVIQIKGEDRVYRIPVFKLNRINDGTSPYQQELQSLDELEIDWAKSYFQYSSAPSGTYSILIGVTYKRRVITT